MSQALDTTIHASLQVTTNLLADFVHQPYLSEKLAIAFGNSFDTNKGISILKSLVDSEFNNLPRFK